MATLTLYFSTTYQPVLPRHQWTQTILEESDSNMLLLINLNL